MSRHFDHATADCDSAVPSFRSRKIGDVAIRRLLASLLLGGSVIPSVGCRLCCNTEDQAYPAYGGVWQRTLRNEGRVGSITNPGGARSSNLSPRGSVPESTPFSDDQLDNGVQETTPESLDRDETPGEEQFQPESDEEFQKRFEEFQREKLEEINIVPGELLPPDLS
jgi:hypothetical protein